MQELQFHVCSYKVKYFPFVRSDFWCQKQFCWSKLKKKKSVSWPYYWWCWVVFERTAKLFKMLEQKDVLSLCSSPSSTSEGQAHCGGSHDCLFCNYHIAGKEKIWTKMLFEELQEPAWKLLPFSMILALNFPFFSDCYFSVCTESYLQWWDLFYFFLSL